MRNIQHPQPCIRSPGTPDHPEQRPASAQINLHINSVDPRPPRAPQILMLDQFIRPLTAAFANAPPKPTNPQPSSGPKNTLTCLARYGTTLPLHTFRPLNRLWNAKEKSVTGTKAQSRFQISVTAWNE